MNRHDPTWPARPGPRPGPAGKEEGQFDELEVSSLFCPKCGRAVPVRKRLLLVLPEGERYEYLCSVCSTSVGRKVQETGRQIRLIHTR